MIRDVATASSGFDGVVKVRSHLPDTYDNAQPSPPAPNVAHTVPESGLRLGILEVAFTDPLARRRFFGSQAFTSTVEAQRAAAEHITAFAVAGVYTFVRDARLSTAGLHRSRVAELIDALAAQNQTAQDVNALFHP